jgi:hypothetical protein
MISFMFILINLTVTLMYTKYPKQLHPIQAASCYLISVIYTHDFLVIPSINLQDWLITKRMDYGLIITLNTMVAVLGMLLIVINNIIKRMIMKLGDAK